MSTFRLRIAIFFAKLTYYTFKLLKHNASHAPGWVALKLYPSYLDQIAKCPLCVCVTGTNGKTTVTNMLSDMLIDNGYSVSTNRIGSNIAPGIASALTNSVSWGGKSVKDACVLEVDERASRLILPFVKPNYLVVTNLFRDSIKRNAHPDYIFDIIDTYTPEQTKLILNADDLCSCRLAETKNNEKVFFGIGEIEGETPQPSLVADYSFCPDCYTKLKYNHLHYHHIGNAYCPNCEFNSPAADYSIKKIKNNDTTISVEYDGRSLSYPLINSVVHNIYNELAVIVTLREIGLPHEQIEASLKKINLVDTRLKETAVGDITVVQAMSKGQTGVSCSRTFDFLRHEDGRKAVVLVVDDYYDRKNSVEYIGWIYDNDYEFLNDKNIVQILVCGPRCYDHQVRLLLAGVDKEKISFCEDELDAHKYVKKDGVDKVFVLYDTSTLNLAMKVKEKTIKVLAEANA